MFGIPPEKVGFSSNECRTRYSLKCNPDSPEVPLEEVCGGIALAGIDRE